MTKKSIRIAFASGKGGTGKTLLSTHMAAWLAQKGQRVTYVDADVEEPNGHLFLHPEVEKIQRFAEPVPELIPNTCTGCGVCQRVCAFHAILNLGKSVIVFHELCHSCGLCVAKCPVHALKEVPLEMGNIDIGRAGQLGYVSGLLDVGQARSTPLVQATVKEGEAQGDAVVIVDCPPGTSCPAMAAMEGSDLVILVTEPTPFGLHDLNLAVQGCRKMGLEVAAVVNRSNLGNREVFEYLKTHEVPLLAEIPFDRKIAEAYARGELVIDRSKEMMNALESIAQTVLPGGAS